MTYERAPLPDREHRRKTIEALPVVGDLGILGTRAALAALFDIRHTNPKLHAHIRDVIDARYQELRETLDDYEDAQGNYVISPLMLRSIVAQGVIAGSTQIAYEVGEAALHVSLLKEMTGLRDEPSIMERGDQEV